MATLNDVLSYIETRAATISDLVDHIKVTKVKEPPPNFKDYGLRVYFGREDWHDVVRNKIGPIYTEIYRINVDLYFNRRLASRQVFSDAKGISYWNQTLIETFINQTNSGMFKDSFWAPEIPMEEPADSLVLRGILTVTLQNTLT